MADLANRPYSPNYSGLINQAGFGGFLLALCWTGYEFMRSARRHRKREPGWGWKWKERLGTVEKWEFGYLYQARAWSLRPSVRLPRWPLWWIKQVIMFPEDKLPEMIGIDQALYARFIRGCWWFTLLHTCTTLPVLLPVNVILTPVTEDNPAKSMTRASLSQLINSLKGIHLLWIHQVALYWLLCTWLFTLWWISRGLWRWRERAIEKARRALESGTSILSPMIPGETDELVEGKTHASRIRHQQEGDLEASVSVVRGDPLPPSIYNLDTPYALNPPYPNIHALHPLPPSSHPHTPYAPSPTSLADRGLRLRTVMVSNVPVGMRSEAELKEYFEYYMSKPLFVPPISPGFLPRILNWFMHRKPAKAAAKKVLGVEGKRLSQPAEPRRSSPDHAGYATPPNGALKRDGVPHSDSNPQPLNDMGVINLDQHNSRAQSPDPNAPPPIIERVVICRKMTELASRVERREEYLRKLEAAHCKLAKKTLDSVKEFMENGGKIKGKGRFSLSRASTASQPAPPQDKKGKNNEVASPEEDLELGTPKPEDYLRTTNQAENSNGETERENSDNSEEDDLDEVFDEEKEQARMELLTKELAPFVEEFYPDLKTSKVGKRASAPLGWRKEYGRVSREGSDESATAAEQAYPPSSGAKVAFAEDPLPPSELPTTTVDGGEKKTIWQVLHALPRSYLDPYQPLVSLSTLFRGATAPAIDYYHVKVGLLTGLIQENRSKPQRDLIPTSTAFVTFHSPRDARRCVRYLPNHPDNLLACIVEPAPDWRDLDWQRIGRSTFTGEFLRDWIVKVGVWGFTLFWIIPVGALVALVSVDKISTFIPGLASYLDRHKYQKEIITAFLPTLLVALLAILVPLLLLLIGKKAHTILTLSRLHDTIMTRYYKFLVCNVLVFFCIGTTTLNTILDSLNVGGNKDPNTTDLVKIVATSFPNAAPFYVGWLVFQTAMHSGLELGLYGLPLMVYPSTRNSATLRRREVGIRPRTYNFYYWLPNHVMVMMIVIVFTILNPLVIPFSLIYFSAAAVVHKNQLMRVYSKWYDQKGTVLLVRIFRYTMDGFLFAEIVFLALNVLTRRSIPGQDVDVLTANIGLTSILMIVTTAIKIYFTTVLRGRFDVLDVKEADAFHNPHQVNAERGIAPPDPPSLDGTMENKLLVDTTVDQKQEVDNQEDQEPPSSTKADYHPGSVRLWNWRLPTEEDFSYRTLPGRIIGRPASPRAPIPFNTEETSEDENGRRGGGSGPNSPRTPISPRRWSVGAIGVGGVTFPKELSDALESPPSPISPTTATSVAPLLSQAAAFEHARSSLERGEESTIRIVTTVPSLDAHGRGRPGAGRATISFDTPPVIVREKKRSTASDSGKSAISKKSISSPSSRRSFVDLPSTLPFINHPEKDSEDSPAIPLIKPHPKTGPWDDAPRYDIPYQNPSYTCRIDDFLWLPRDPIGKLNIDDTIEMRKAIRTEAHLGALGEWVDDGTSFDVVPRNTVASHAASLGTIPNPDALTITSVGDGSEIISSEPGGIPLSRRVTSATTKSGYTQRLLNGMEHIHLPPGIRARLPKKTDEFGFRRKKTAASAILSESKDEIEQSEGAEMQERGYFTIKDRRPSVVSRPGIGARGSSTRYSPSTARTEGHASTSTLGLRRARSSRSVLSRSSATTRDTNISNVTEDPALQPDFSNQSPFLDPGLSIILTRNRTNTQPAIPQTHIDDPRRTHSLFTNDGAQGGRHLIADAGMDVPTDQESTMRRVRSRGGLSARSSGRSRRDSISVRDAIVGEVLAEEQVATARRVREELEEAERVAGPRSYWTGWMWRQVPNNPPQPSSTSQRDASSSRRDLHEDEEGQE